MKKKMKSSFSSLPPELRRTLDVFIREKGEQILALDKKQHVCIVVDIPGDNGALHTISVRGPTNNPEARQHAEQIRAAGKIPVVFSYPDHYEMYGARVMRTAGDA